MKWEIHKVSQKHSKFANNLIKHHIYVDPMKKIPWKQHCILYQICTLISRYFFLRKNDKRKFLQIQLCTVPIECNLTWNALYLIIFSVIGNALFNRFECTLLVLLVNICKIHFNYYLLGTSIDYIDSMQYIHFTDFCE